MPDNRQLAPHSHIVLPPGLGEPVHVDPFPEQEHVRRSAKVEHARLVALLHVLALLDRDLARAHLVHADADEGHQADGRVVRLDEDDGARGQTRQVALHRGDALLDLGLLVRAVDVARVVQRLTEVGPVDDVGLLDGARHGCVPAVVGQGAQEGLVDGAARELVRKRIRGEHVDDRVGLALDPELVAELDVALHGVRAGLARVGDDVVVVRGGHGAGGLVHVAREEVVPGGVAILGLGGVADVHVFEFVGGLVGRVGYGHQVVDARLAEPARVVVAEDFGRLRSLDFFSVFIFKANKKGGSPKRKDIPGDTCPIRSTPFSASY